MNILGINGGFRLGYQDVAAALLQNGKLSAAIEEERLTRIKYSPGQLPLQSIHEILKLTELSISQIDCVAMHGETWSGEIKKRIANYFKFNFHHSPEIVLVHHHDAHAASSFFASGFEEALIITFDNSGDGVSTQISIGKDSEIKVLKRLSRPDSLGIFYSAITQYCGFTRDADEYKLMGLSAYANSSKIDLSDFVRVTEDGYSINEKYIAQFESGQPGPTRNEFLFSEELEKYLGFRSANFSNKKKSEQHIQLAYAAQKKLEEAALSLIKYWLIETGMKKLCLAGGVAMNCVMNQKILESTDVTSLYVPPFAGDQGVSVGAAMLVCAQKGMKPLPLYSPYLGREFSHKEIEETLSISNIPYQKIKDAAHTAATLVAEGKIIGWFQGKSEIGARALGNRSILANPAIKGMKERINSKIKFRESFRPFCPSVLEEDFDLFFQSNIANLPFMNITALVKERAKKIISEVVHADGSARVQTVNSSTNKLFYDYLIALKKITGVGVTINTSFNVRNHPIVNSPANALECYFSSGLDALVIGNYLLLK